MSTTTRKTLGIKKAKPLTDVDAVAEAAERVSSDFQYHVNYENNRSHEECDEDAESPYDRHRRCRIVDFEVKSVPIDAVRDEICKTLRDPIKIYCIDRLLSIHKVYETGHWEHDARPDYYGETMVKVEIGPGIQRVLKEDILKLYGKTSKECIEVVLKGEYGFVLDELIPASSYSIIKCARENIKLPNKTYAKRLERKAVDAYQKRELPLGIFRRVGDKCEVIDGYHRTTAFLEGESKSALIIVPDFGDDTSSD